MKAPSITTLFLLLLLLLPPLGTRGISLRLKRRTHREIADSETFVPALESSVEERFLSFGAAEDSVLTCPLSRENDNDSICLGRLRRPRLDARQRIHLFLRSPEGFSNEGRKGTRGRGEGGGGHFCRLIVEL